MTRVSKTLTKAGEFANGPRCLKTRALRHQPQLETRSFELVCGLGELHHLDLQQALRKASRAWTAWPCSWSRSHNPVLRLYRRLTPAQRTVDEHALRAKDLETLQRYFGRTEIAYFHLLTIFAPPLAGRTSFEPAISRLLEALDRLLVRSPLRH